MLLSILLLLQLSLSMVPLLFGEVQAYGRMRYPVDGWEWEKEGIGRPNKWRLNQWRSLLGINAHPTRFISNRHARSVDSPSAAPIMPSSESSTVAEGGQADLVPLFGDESVLLKKLGQEDEEPLVFSRYNRDCFFTPINCFVGRAGQQASNIVGSASNSKRQILFIKKHRRRQQQRKSKRGDMAMALARKMREDSFQL